MPPRSLAESCAFSLDDDERRRAQLKQHLYQQQPRSRGESATSAMITRDPMNDSTATTATISSSCTSISSVENQESAASPTKADDVEFFGTEQNNVVVITPQQEYYYYYQQQLYH
jgi:hypothetical protein